MATENMSLVLPEQDSDDGTWGTKLNTALGLVDSHDHSTGKGVKVTPAGLNINASLELNGQSATEIGTLDFNANTDAATASKVRAFYWDAAGELCIRNGSSTKLAITSGGGTSLNSSILGGIEGDYAATSASLYYEDAGKRYLALQSTGPNVWAEVACGDLALFEKASGIVNRVRLKSPAALAASYEVTFPAALPGSTSVATISSAGAIAASRDLSIDSITTSGDATIGGTLAATVAVDVLHGDRTKTFNPVAGEFVDGAYTDANGYWLSSAGPWSASISLVMENGQRIKTITMARYGSGSGSINLTLRKMAADGTRTSIQTETDSNPAASWADTTLTLSSPETVNDAAYWIYVDGTTTAHRFTCLRVTYDRPA